MAEPTSAEIEQQINAIQPPAGPETPQAPETPAQPAQTPEPVQPGQGEPEPQGQPPSDVPAQGAQVETPAAVPSELEKLMREKGINDPNMIAKIYHDLEADHTRKSQELARLRQENAQPTPQAPQPEPLNREALNQRFVEDLAKDPVGTMAKLVDVLASEKVRPFEETRKEGLLNSEIIRLSTSPDTAQTFNLKQVQDEMKVVVAEDPAYLDNLPRKLATLHDIALGRLVRRGFTVNATKKQIPAQNPVPEGGPSKAAAPQVFDEKKASAAELEAHINSLAQG